MNIFNHSAKHFKTARWISITTFLVGSLFWHAGPDAIAAGASTALTVDAPVLEQTTEQNSEKANVVVDGRPIFQVETAGDYTAQQRAGNANQLLAELAESAENAEIKVVEHNHQPVLLANEQYLLTVTEPDTNLEKTPSELAQVWASEIERSLHSSKRERSPSHLKEMSLVTSLTLGMAIALHISLGYLWRRSPQYASQYSSSPANLNETEAPNTQNAHLSAILKLWLFRLAIWAISLSHISSLFPHIRQQRYSLLNHVTTGIQSPIFSLGNQAYSLIELLMLVALMVVLFALVRLSTRLLATHVLKRTPLARGSREVITQSFRYGAFSLGMFILLQLWGIDLRSVALLGSALGIGIGFGLQDIAKNFGSGLVLLFERSVQVGDFIEIGPHTGTVERIGARSITIRTLDHISVLVPNAHLLDSQVINWNHDHAISRLHLTIGTAYEADSKLVKSLLLQAARENKEVLPVPAPNVFLKNFGDSAIEFDLMVWIRNPERHAAIRSALNFRIEEILNYHKISIPFPQRDVNLHMDSVPVEFSPEVKEALLDVFAKVKKMDAFPRKRVNASQSHLSKQHSLEQLSQRRA
ncbi:MAG: mechanosensitive ion channel family protein [Phormidesmis sp.]